MVVPAGMGIAAAIFLAASLAGPGDDDRALGESTLTGWVEGSASIGGQQVRMVLPGQKITAEGDAWVSLGSEARIGLRAGGTFRYQVDVGDPIIEVEEGWATIASLNEGLNVAGPGWTATLSRHCVAVFSVTAAGTEVTVVDGEMTLQPDGGIAMALQAGDQRVVWPPGLPIMAPPADVLPEDSVAPVAPPLNEAPSTDERSNPVSNQPPVAPKPATGNETSTGEGPPSEAASPTQPADASNGPHSEQAPREQPVTGPPNPAPGETSTGRAGVEPSAGPPPDQHAAPPEPHGGGQVSQPQESAPAETSNPTDPPASAAAVGPPSSLPGVTLASLEELPRASSQAIAAASPLESAHLTGNAAAANANGSGPSQPAPGDAKNPVKEHPKLKSNGASTDSSSGAHSASTPTEATSETSEETPSEQTKLADVQGSPSGDNTHLVSTEEAKPTKAETPANDDSGLNSTNKTKPGAAEPPADKADPHPGTPGNADEEHAAESAGDPASKSGGDKPIASVKSDHVGTGASASVGAEHKAAEGHSDGPPPPRSRPPK